MYFHNTTHMTYASSYVFQHQGAIIRESLQQRRTSHPANVCCVPTCTHN